MFTTTSTMVLRWMLLVTAVEKPIPAGSTFYLPLSMKKTEIPLTFGNIHAIGTITSDTIGTITSNTITTTTSDTITIGARTGISLIIMETSMVK
ncbi:hypothetical protein BGX24_010755, partial [Mortierella sp. AD032]